MKESRTLYASHFDTCPRRQQRWNLENRSQRSKPRVKSSKVASRNTCAKKVAGSGQLKTWNRTSSRKRKDWGTMVSELFFAWTVHHTSKIEDLSLRFPCLLQLQLHPASSFFVSLRDSFPPSLFRSISLFNFYDQVRPSRLHRGASSSFSNPPVPALCNEKCTRNRYFPPLGHVPFAGIRKTFAKSWANFSLCTHFCRHAQPGWIWPAFL